MPADGVPNSFQVAQQSTSSPKGFLSLILKVAILLLVGGVSGYYFGVSNTLTDSIVPNDVPVKNIAQTSTEKYNISDSSSINSSNDENTSVSLERLGISIKFPDFFPETITSLEIKGADSGKQACKNITDGGVIVFSICATSRHFTAGRGGTFLDTHGYLESPNGYYILYPFNEDEISKENAQKFTSEQGAEVLKIYGKNRETEFGVRPIPGSPGDGYIAAVINTGDPDNYDGIAVTMKLSGKYTESEFDQILSSINLQ